MNWSGKIKAVTLTEVLVVLAITAIVASLAFTVLNYFTRSMDVVSKNYAGNTELQLLEQQLTADFNLYPTIRFNAKKEKLILQSPLDSIAYQLDESFVIREQDTVFKGSLLFENYYLGKKTEGGTSDALKISITKEKITKHLFVSKPRSVASLWD